MRLILTGKGLIRFETKSHGERRLLRAILSVGPIKRQSRRKK